MKLRPCAAAAAPVPPPALSPARQDPSPTDRVTLAGPQSADLRLAEARQAATEEAISLQAKVGEHVPGDLLVKICSGRSDETARALAADFGFVVSEKFSIPECMREKFGGELFLLKTLGRASTSEGMAILGRSPYVDYVVANQILKAVDTRVPNDLDERLWGLRNSTTPGADIHAADAWGISTGKRENGPVVAVIDSGIDYAHPDLAANMWHNPDEDAPDRHGVNFVGNTPDPMDDNHHGSHVAGTIAAEGNNGRGVVGVNWQGRLMALKFLSNKGRGSTADAIRSVLYASAHGARLTNNSWGGGGFNEALQDALRASPALHLVAAGNDFSDNDRNPRYPASYLLDNMVVVAASDRRDEKASFSNWGRRTVDLAAPGEGIYSTTPGNTYETLSGTSMATPHVAGVAALIASQYPGISNAQIKARLTHSVDHVEALRPLVISGGRLNAFRALENDTVAPAAPGDLRGLQAGISTATVGWTASGDDGRAGTASTYELRFSEAPLDEGNFAAATRVDARWPSPAGTAERADVELVPSAQPRTLHVGLKVYDNVGNASGLVTALVNVPAARVVFEDKMENGTANWSPEIPWGLVDEAAHGKVWASSPNGLQDNAANTSLLSRPIDLGGVRNPQLIFNARWDLEKGYDFLNVELSDDAGKTWTVLGRHTFSTDWHKEMHDLFAWQGKQVVVRFRVETDRSVQSRGVRLDDVVVAGSGAQK